MEHHFSIGGVGKVERGWSADGKVVYRTGAAGERVSDHLEFMDKAGIDMAALTTSSAANVKSWTDACAKVVKQYPKRFIGFAPTLPLGGKPAFDEMERAIKDLGMKGIHITARPEGRHLDSRELWPFYEKVSQLGVPIDVHINAGGLDLEGFLDAPYALFYTMAREYDISAATLRICLGGVLEDFPNLVFIMNHFGGGVSAVMERLDLYMNLMGDSFYRGKPLINKPWREYFNKLYFSMAGREIGMATVKCALTTINPKKLMFGTDWSPNFEDNPQGAMKYIQEIRKLPLSNEDIEGMLGGNAAKLVGIQK